MDDGAPDRSRPGVARAPLPGPSHDLLAALAVLTGLVAAAVLVGLAYAAGADMVEMQLLGSTSSPLRVHVLGTLVALVLVAVAVVCAARISAPDGAWPSALRAAGVSQVVLAAVLLAVHGAHWGVGMTIADTALVSGATSAGQWVGQGGALLLAVGAVPCLRTDRARRWPHGGGRRRTPV